MQRRRKLNDWVGVHEALHTWGVLRQVIAVWPVVKVRGLVYFSSFALAYFFFTITVVFLLLHTLNDIIVVVRVVPGILRERWKDR